MCKLQSFVIFDYFTLWLSRVYHCQKQTSLPLIMGNNILSLYSVFFYFKVVIRLSKYNTKKTRHGDFYYLADINLGK